MLLECLPLISWKMLSNWALVLIHLVTNYSNFSTQQFWFMFDLWSHSKNLFSKYKDFFRICEIVIKNREKSIKCDLPYYSNIQLIFRLVSLFESPCSDMKSSLSFNTWGLRSLHACLSKLSKNKNMWWHLTYIIFCRAM